MAPWTIWQPPQLPFRNYYGCMAPARVWGYIATIYEFGGVGGLVHAGFHMTFSSFSLPLELVSEADPWDGDVIADDHHCYLKCFLYSIYKQASKLAQAGGSCGIDPPLVVRPVMLPVKSTSVVADGCFSSYSARFNQAKRHSQGVAELSYIFLGVFNCYAPCQGERTVGFWSENYGGSCSFHFTLTCCQRVKRFLLRPCQSCGF